VTPEGAVRQYGRLS